MIILYFASTIPEHGAVRSKEDEVTHTNPTFIHNSHPLIPANKNSLRAAGGPAQILTTANLNDSLQNKNSLRAAGGPAQIFIALNFHGQTSRQSQPAKHK